MTRPPAIRPRAYEALSPIERVRAYLAAERRGDSDESRRLVETCERKEYSQTDTAFSDFLERLRLAALGIESDLERAALDFLIGSRQSQPAGRNMATAAIEHATAIVAAWQKVVAENGLDAADVEAFGPPRHPAVIALLGIALADPDLEAVGAIAEDIRQILTN